MIKFSRNFFTLRRKLKTLLKGLGLRSVGVREVPLQERQGYETVFDDDVMTVLHIPGRKDECIVSFTGVGHALGGIDLQNPEFARSDSDETKIFIIDKQRSWGNNLDWRRVKNLVYNLAPSAQITTLGNSMGGFLAILSAPILEASQAIAFAPQWSIDPATVPEENRWLEYRQKIEKIHYSDLSEAVRSQSKIYVFFGINGKLDEIHMNFFRQAKTEAFVLRNCGHDVAGYMKKNGLLYPVISACREGGNVAALLTKADISVVAD